MILKKLTIYGFKEILSDKNLMNKNIYILLLYYHKIYVDEY